MEEEMFGLAAANQRGIRHRHLSGENWWSRTCTDKRRPLEVQRLRNRGDGCGGKLTWSELWQMGASNISFTIRAIHR